jgi:hypothetical protein
MSPNIIICFGNNKAAQFHFWEHIIGDQAFIFDSHWPFICNVDKFHIPSHPDPDPQYGTYKKNMGEEISFPHKFI